MLVQEGEKCETYSKYPSSLTLKRTFCTSMSGETFTWKHEGRSGNLEFVEVSNARGGVQTNNT